MNKRAAIDWNTVLRYMAGGAMVGTGAGAATSLMRYLSTLREKAKAQTDTSKDDDVLYVNLPSDPTAMAPHPTKIASADGANSAATFAASGLAGMAGLVGAYSLVRKTYSKLRRKQLQGELDQAQQAYLGGLQTSSQMAKSAADKQFGMLSKGVGTGYLLGLLSIMGSAVVTNKVLQKYFPPIKSPLKGKPRKIVVRSMPPATPKAAPGGTGMDKTIPVPEGDVTPEEMENLIRQNVALSKTAGIKSPMDMDDLLAAVAQGRGAEIKQVLNQGMDPLNVMDLVKGASAQPVDSVRHNLAIGWVAYDPMIRNAFGPIIASEFAELAPAHFKMAHALSQEEREDVAGLSAAANQAVRASIFAPVIDKLSAGSTKVANQMPALLKNPLLGNLVLANALHDVLTSGQNDQQEQQDPRGAERTQTVLAGSLTSQDSSDSVDVKKDEQNRENAKNSKGMTFQVEDQAAGQFVAKNRDIIDEALARTS